MRTTASKRWWTTKSAMFVIATVLALATAGVVVAFAQAGIMDPPLMVPGPGATIAVTWLPVAPIGSNATTYTLSYDTSNPFTATQTITTTHTAATIPGADGVTYFAVVQADDGSHVLSDPSAVAQATADGIAPVSSFAAVPASPDGLNGWYKSVPTASMSIVDTGTGLQSFTVNGLDVSLDPGMTFGFPPGPSTYAVPTLGQGVNSWSFFGTDVAGNVETPVKGATVSVDSVAPSVAIAVATNSAHITATDAVPGSGVNHIDYVFLPSGSSPDTFTVWTTAAGSSVTSTSPAGQYTAFARSVDTAGNVSSIQQAALNTFTLSYSAGTGGSIVGSATQVVTSGSNGTTVTATPGPGFHFVSWSDGYPTAIRQDLNVLANHTVSATFAIDTFTLSYSTGANGSIVGSSTQNVNYAGSGTTVTATPSLGYRFVSWSDGYPTAVRQDLNVTANLTVSATFAINTFTLSYSAGTGGSIAGSSTQVVNYGSNGTTVTATPATGYHFMSWSDGVLTAARQDLNVTADKTVTATFSNTFTLTYTAGTNGSIVGSSTQVVVSGADGTQVTATPNTGYHFVTWSDGVLTAARTDLGVLANKAVSASFAINTYTLSYSAVANGSIVGSSTQVVNYGSNGTTVTASPATGYHFVSWSDGYPTAVRQDLNVTANLTVSASFAINTFTLSYTAGVGGSIVGSSTQVVNYGSNGTTVTATPATGYHFVSWSDGVLTAARQDLNVTANKTVTATFSNTFTLTYTAGVGGSIVGSSTQVVVSGADGTQVTATPNTGYHFVSWSDGVLTAARTDLAVVANKTVSASFAINTFTLTYTAGAHGSISGTTPQTVNYAGSGSLIAAIPSSGYHFVSWSDGVMASTRTDTNVTANLSVSASFAINTYTLTYTAGTHGTITGTSPQTVNSGADGTLVTAVADTGYHFVSWSDGVTTAARTDTNVTANVSVTATFASTVYTLTYSAGPHGGFTGISPQMVAAGGDGTLVTAVPATGYHFVSWSDGLLTAARTDINVTANLTVSPSFAINTYTLTYTPGAHGTITGTSPQSVDYGSDGTTVTAVPDATYQFVSWSDGVTTAARRDTNVVANHTVTATFALSVIRTSLSINSRYTSLVHGRTDYFYGTISPNVPNGTHVRFYVKRPGSRWWSPVATLNTFSSHHWSYSYRLASRGTYYFQVRFSSSSRYVGSFSRIISVRSR